jgi:hypothetical protein
MAATIRSRVVEAEILPAGTEARRDSPLFFLVSGFVGCAFLCRAAERFKRASFAVINVKNRQQLCHLQEITNTLR